MKAQTGGSVAELLELLWIRRELGAFAEKVRADTEAPAAAKAKLLDVIEDMQRRPVPRQRAGE